MMIIVIKKEGISMIRDLTQGKPEQVLRQFTLPLFISVIFQQFYNMADTAIVGRFAAHGEDAVAAIGASHPITMIFMAIAIGSNIGCSVVISQLFGGKQFARMKTAITTTLTACVGLSLILSALGLIFSSLLLRLVDTPENIFADAGVYLNIYIGGFIFLFLYNVCNGMFTSLGDSRTPLYFLIGSSIGNIVLDWLFVAVLHLDVAGVAWATFIAQGSAAILAFITLLRRLHAIECEPHPFFSLPLLGQISRIALPSILQQSFISVGNICVQRLINGYGSAVIAGFSSAAKLNTFAITLFSTLSNGVSGFTAQNLGANRPDRVKRGFRGGLYMAAVLVGASTLLYVLFAPACVNLFLDGGKSPDAIATGVAFLRTAAPFYFLPAAKLVADGVLRGGGAMKQFMTSTFLDLILRVLLGYLFASRWGVNGIWFSWPVGWAAAFIISMVAYARGTWQKKTA